ncbi:MAG: hypothetical protein V1679_00600 [Candidatus Peregrinibacteria bacterium]
MSETQKRNGIVGPRQKTAIEALTQGGIKTNDKEILGLQRSFSSLLEQVNSALSKNTKRKPRSAPYNPTIRAEECLASTKEIIEIFESGGKTRLKRLKESHQRVKNTEKIHSKKEKRESIKEKIDKILNTLTYIKEIINWVVLEPQQSEQTKEAVVKALRALDNLKAIKAMEAYTEKIRKRRIKILENIILRVYSSTPDTTPDTPPAPEEEIIEVFEPEDYTPSYSQRELNYDILDEPDDPKELKF